MKVEDWLDDLSIVGTFAAEKIGEATKDMPIIKAAGQVLANPTPQEVGAQAEYLGKTLYEGVKEEFSKSPEELALNWGPGAIGGTIIGKGAKGWAQAEGKFSSMFDKTERAEISDIKAKLKIDGRTWDNLENILNHPRLYKEYPWLKKMEVSIDYGPGILNPQGTYYPYKNRSSEGLKDIQEMIEVRASNKESAKETLLHEIQHAIQEKEKFTKGSSPTIYPPRSASAEVITEKEILSDKIRNLYKDYASNKEEIKRLEERLNNLSIPSQYYDYKRTAGEIESRSVARRSNIPQEQLKYSQPYAGENIPLKEWIKAEDFLDQ